MVSDEAGRNYWGLRGTDDFVTGMTHVVSPVCGFRSLHPGGMLTPELLDMMNQQFRLVRGR